jgi:hypothetical protein
MKLQSVLVIGACLLSTACVAPRYAPLNCHSAGSWGCGDNGICIDSYTPREHRGAWKFDFSRNVFISPARSGQIIQTKTLDDGIESQLEGGWRVTFKSGRGSVQISERQSVELTCS